MGKKYIIELEEPEMFDEQKFYQCTQMPWWSMSENVVENLTPYIEPDLEQVRKEAYEQGLNDAWEAARKIIHMPEGNLLNLFDVYSSVCTPVQVMLKYDASEVIAKIKAWEDGGQEIKVGDEVIPRETEYDDMIVTRLWKDDYDSDCIDAIGFDGRIGSFLVSRVSKTGKHYEIAEVLRKMRESE